MAKSQKVVIKIGHMEVMLPDDTGAATIVKALSRGIVVWHLGDRKVQIREEQIQVSLSYLPANTVFENEDREVLKPKPPASKRKLLALPAPTMLELMERRAE